MNQAQRNYLVEEIEKSVDMRIKALDESKPEYPNASLYLFNAVMSGKLELQSNEKITEVIRQKALKDKTGNNWLGGDRWGESTNEVKFNLKEIFIFPKEYQEKLDEYKKISKEVNEKIDKIEGEKKALVMRVKLASNNILEKLIMEVDDMGELSLMDTKLKQLTK